MYFLLLNLCIFSLIYDCIAEGPYLAPLCLKHVTCARGEKMLNDCNWCKCIGGKFLCESRDCKSVDMFGHFNDAIQGISVGMEGHGAWRSGPISCEPNVQYARNSTLCICTSQGSWPNPICRDIFRVLYTVKDTGLSEIKSNQKCTPKRLYLIGCNTCFCPENGLIDPKLCTERDCTDTDPVKKSVGIKNALIGDDSLVDVYAECEISKKFSFGCKQCTCLSNNRLECSKCDKEILNSRCKSKLNGEVYSSDCNLCFCDEKGVEYCSAKHCITGAKRSNLEKKLSVTPPVDNQVVDPVYDITNCTPGTSFKFGCKYCYCMKYNNNTVVVGCNLHKCNKLKSPLESIEEKCVNNTLYKKNCMLCICEKSKGLLFETCKVDRKCVKKNNLHKVKNVENLPGYCEPLHLYKDKCNECKCLAKGTVLACTSKYCDAVMKSNELGQEPNGTTIEVTPIIPKVVKECAKGQGYKVDCNVCFCLDNGNALCSFKNCNK